MNTNAHSPQQTRINSISGITKILTGVVSSALLLISIQVQAGDLDDISIQIIGLDKTPSEALQVIQLPAPAAGSIADAQGDVIFNKPLSPLNPVLSEFTNPSASPVVDGGTGIGGGGSGGAGGGTGP